MQEATRKKKSVRRRWQLVVRLIQWDFRYETLLKELKEETMIFLPKRKREYQGIGIVEVAWKVCAAVVNCWIKRSVETHYVLHGFSTGQGTGTATLEAKLIQKLAGIAHKPLFR